MDRYDELASAWAKDQGWAEDEALHERTIAAHALKWNNERREKETCEWKLMFKGDTRKQQWLTGCGAGCIYKDTTVGIEKFCFNCGRRIVEVKDE